MKARLLFKIIAVVSFCWLLPANARAHPATGIVVDRAGNVYFSDLETIWKLSTDGTLTVFREGQRGRHIHELGIDDHDNIYGADVSYNPATKGWPSNVWNMTPDGKLTYLLETTENAPRGMSIWRDRDGNMFWVEQNNHTKTQTLLLKRTPAGVVTTLAGSSYGHADGKGTSAKFSSVGGVAFGPDGSIYLSDGASVRRVAMDGTVTTVGSGLDFRDPADQRRFLTGSSGSLTGLSVAADGAVYVADSGNRRLFKISRDGKAEVILRTEPPFFPNGVAVVNGNVYVLEVGFTLPNISSGPRVRKITPEGTQTILAIVGEPAKQEGKSSLAEKAGVTAEGALVLASGDGRLKYTITLGGVVIFSIGLLVWLRRRRSHA
jgi:sugar lactone lactonase YvrE